MSFLNLKHTLPLLRGQEVETLLEGQTLLGELVVGGEAGCVGGRKRGRGGGWGGECETEDTTTTRHTGSHRGVLATSLSSGGLIDEVVSRRHACRQNYRHTSPPLCPTFPLSFSNSLTRVSRVGNLAIGRLLLERIDPLSGRVHVVHEMHGLLACVCLW